MDDISQIVQDYPIGMFLRKVRGYDWPGRVAGYGLASTGSVSLVVENRLSPGTMHIFPVSYLSLEDRTDQEILDAVAARMLRKETADEDL